MGVVKASDQQAGDIIRKVARSFFDPSVEPPYCVEWVKLVEQPNLNQWFAEKEKLMQRKRRTKKELEVQIGFTVENDSTWSAIAHGGLQCAPGYPKKLDNLGDPSHGVFINIYADLCLKSTARKFLPTVKLMVYKYMQGRSRRVVIPTSVKKSTELFAVSPDYDSHISYIVPQKHSSVDTNLERNRVFLFDLDESEKPRRYPRQVVPIAVIHFRRAERLSSVPSLALGTFSQSACLATATTTVRDPVTNADNHCLSSRKFHDEQPSSSEVTNPSGECQLSLKCQPHVPEAKGRDKKLLQPMLEKTEGIVETRNYMKRLQKLRIKVYKLMHGSGKKESNPASTKVVITKLSDRFSGLDVFQEEAQTARICSLPSRESLEFLEVGTQTEKVPSKEMAISTCTGLLEEAISKSTKALLGNVTCTDPGVTSAREMSNMMHSSRKAATSTKEVQSLNESLSSILNIIQKQVPGHTFDRIIHELQNTQGLISLLKEKGVCISTSAISSIRSGQEDGGCNTEPADDPIGEQWKTVDSVGDSYWPEHAELNNNEEAGSEKGKNEMPCRVVTDSPNKQCSRCAETKPAVATVECQTELCSDLPLHSGTPTKPHRILQQLAPGIRIGSGQLKQILHTVQSLSPGSSTSCTLNHKHVIPYPELEKQSLVSYTPSVDPAVVSNLHVDKNHLRDILENANMGSSAHDKSVKSIKWHQQQMLVSSEPEHAKVDVDPKINIPMSDSAICKEILKEILDTAQSISSTSHTRSPGTDQLKGTDQFQSFGFNKTMLKSDPGLSPSNLDFQNPKFEHSHIHSSSIGQLSKSSVQSMPGVSSGREKLAEVAATSHKQECTIHDTIVETGFQGHVRLHKIQEKELVQKNIDNLYSTTNSVDLKSEKKKNYELEPPAVLSEMKTHEHGAKEKVPVCEAVSPHILQGQGSPSQQVYEKKKQIVQQLDVSLGSQDAEKNVNFSHERSSSVDCSISVRNDRLSTAGCSKIEGIAGSVNLLSPKNMAEENAVKSKSLNAAALSAEKPEGCASFSELHQKAFEQVSKDENGNPKQPRKGLQGDVEDAKMTMSNFKPATTNHPQRCSFLTSACDTSQQLAFHPFPISTQKGCETSHGSKEEKHVSSKKAKKFHGRTLLAGKNVPSRNIPHEPLYLTRPFTSSGQPQIRPKDPRLEVYPKKGIYIPFAKQNKLTDTASSCKDKELKTKSYGIDSSQTKLSMDVPEQNERASAEKPTVEEHKRSEAPSQRNIWQTLGIASEDLSQKTASSGSDAFKEKMHNRTYYSFKGLFGKENDGKEVNRAFESPKGLCDVDLAEGHEKERFLVNKECHSTENKTETAPSKIQQENAFLTSKPDSEASDVQVEPGTANSRPSAFTRLSKPCIDVNSDDYGDEFHTENEEKTEGALQLQGLYDRICCSDMECSDPEDETNKNNSRQQTEKAKNTLMSVRDIPLPQENSDKRLFVTKEQDSSLKNSSTEKTFEPLIIQVDNTKASDEGLITSSEESAENYAIVSTCQKLPEKHKHENRKRKHRKKKQSKHDGHKKLSKVKDAKNGQQINMQIEKGSLGELLSRKRKASENSLVSPKKIKKSISPIVFHSGKRYESVERPVQHRLGSPGTVRPPSRGSIYSEHTSSSSSSASWHMSQHEEWTRRSLTQDRHSVKSRDYLDERSCSVDEYDARHYLANKRNKELIHSGGFHHSKSSKNNSGDSTEQLRSRSPSPHYPCSYVEEVANFAEDMRRRRSRQLSDQDGYENLKITVEDGPISDDTEFLSEFDHDLHEVDISSRSDKKHSQTELDVRSNNMCESFRLEDDLGDEEQKIAFGLGKQNYQSHERPSSSNRTPHITLKTLSRNKKHYRAKRPPSRNRKCDKNYISPLRGRNHDTARPPSRNQYHDNIERSPSRTASEGRMYDTIRPPTRNEHLDNIERSPSRNAENNSHTSDTDDEPTDEGLDIHASSLRNRTDSDSDMAKNLLDINQDRRSPAGPLPTPDIQSLLSMPYITSSSTLMNAPHPGYVQPNPHQIVHVQTPTTMQHTYYPLYQSGNQDWVYNYTC